MVLFESLIKLFLAFRNAHIILFSYFSQKVVDDASFLERSSDESLPFVHVSNHGGVVDKLDVSCFKPRFHGIVAHHVHVQVVPQLVHDFEELKYEVVLPQVVT